MIVQGTTAGWRERRYRRSVVSELMALRLTPPSGLRTVRRRPSSYPVRFTFLGPRRCRKWWKNRAPPQFHRESAVSGASKPPKEGGASRPDRSRPLAGSTCPKRFYLFVPSVWESASYYAVWPGPCIENHPHGEIVASMNPTSALTR